MRRRGWSLKQGGNRGTFSLLQFLSREQVQVRTTTGKLKFCWNPCVAGYVCTLSTQATEPGGLPLVWGQPELGSGFRTSLGDIGRHSHNKQRQTEELGWKAKVLEAQGNRKFALSRSNQTGDREYLKFFSETCPTSTDEPCTGYAWDSLQMAPGG